MLLLDDSRFATSCPLPGGVGGIVGSAFAGRFIFQHVGRSGETVALLARRGLTQAPILIPTRRECTKLHKSRLLLIQRRIPKHLGQLLSLPRIHGRLWRETELAGQRPMDPLDLNPESVGYLDGGKSCPLPLRLARRQVLGLRGVCDWLVTHAYPPRPPVPMLAACVDVLSGVPPIGKTCANQQGTQEAHHEERPVAP